MINSTQSEWISTIAPDICNCSSPGTSATLRGVFVLIELVLMVAIGLGNGLVIAAFFRSPQLRTISHYLILHLAIADLSVALWMPMHISMFIQPALLGSIKLAVLRYSSLTLSMGASLSALVLLTLDRFMAIVRPLHYFGHLTIRRCMVLGLSVWLIPLAFGFILPLSWHTQWHEMDVRSHDLVIVLKPAYIKYVMVPYLHICFIIILVLYIPILKASRQHIKAIRRDARIAAISLPPHSISIIRDASYDMDMSQWSTKLNIVTPEAVNLEQKASILSSSPNIFQTGPEYSYESDKFQKSNQETTHHQMESQINVLGSKADESRGTRDVIMEGSDMASVIELVNPLQARPVPPNLDICLPLSTDQGSKERSVGWNNSDNTLPGQVTPAINTKHQSSSRTISSTIIETTECSLYSMSAASEESSTKQTPQREETPDPLEQIPQVTVIVDKAGKRTYTSGTLSEIKMCKTGGIIFAAFFLSWIPFTIVTSVQVYGNKVEDQVLVALSPYVAFLAILNSALNPLVYAFKLRDFKVQFRRMLGLSTKMPRGKIIDMFSVEEARTG